MPHYVLATVISVLALVQAIVVKQMPVYVLATVISVLALVQHIAVPQVPAYVLATVISVLVLVQHITAQQVMLSVLIQLPHVPVLVVAQHLIVLLALTLMVYADIQHVVVILAVTHMIMVYNVQPVNPVVVALVHLCQLVPQDMVALPHTIGAMAGAAVQHPPGRARTA